MSLVSVPISRMFLLNGKCSVPLSPLVRSCSDGGATFTGPAGNDLWGVFTYNLPGKGAQLNMLAVFFHVPPGCNSNSSNNFAVDIIPQTKCDQGLHTLMAKSSAKGPLKATKARACSDDLVVRATMSETANAVLKVDVSNVPQ